MAQPVPVSVAPLVARDIAALEQALRAQNLQMPNPAELSQLQDVFAKSQFIAETLIREPASLAELLQGRALRHTLNESDYQKRVMQALSPVADQKGLESALRRLRRLEMLRIAWRDLSGLADLSDMLKELSGFANACVANTLAWLHARACAEAGLDPVTVPPLLVVALGKLGGGELNFSSDIDLLFVRADQAQFEGAERFYLGIAQQLINVLDRFTAEGYVFRVDMRLRPFGESGMLVLSQTALQDYYTTHGRDWERYAMIKAQVITGRPCDRTPLLSILRRFSYRPYVDFAMQAAVRHMKSLLVAEVQRKQRKDNIKLGPGGIREIEFMVQSLQLIHGGKLPALQQASLYQALIQLETYHYLSPDWVDTLRQSYEFLRQLEHKLQMLHDQQTHDLPKTPLDQARIAYAMGYADWRDLYNKIEQVRNIVSTCFNKQLAPEVPAQPAASAINPAELDYQELHTLTAKFRAKYRDSNLSALARQRLEVILPILQQTAAQLDRSASVLQAALALLDSIVRRSTYVSLLFENQLLLKPLLRLLADSPWINGLLRQYPALLAELCDKDSLAPPLEGAPLKAALATVLQPVAEADIERQMEVLRYFKLAYTLRIALADLQGQLPLMRVSDHLSDLAATLVQAVEVSAWQTTAARYGMLPGTSAAEHGFAVVAYGKLGGIELGYSSDLDLVFLYQDEPESGSTPIVSFSEFYVKLAQRLVYLLQTKTYSGALYEADLRLRPSGNAGLLVSSISAFADYQTQHARIWEHQALLRARIIVGSDAIRERFSDIRRLILCQVREPAILRRAVIEMRDKMRGAQKVKPEDLKHGRGGLIDIEFLVQYLALQHAAAYPELVTYTDNIRILEACAKTGVLRGADAGRLIEIYRQMRALIHHRLLQSETLSYAELPKQREWVQTLWDRYLHG